MKDQQLWLLILLMGLVTYIPRMLPIVILQKLQLPKFVKRQFEFIPFAALSALIFPSILHSTGSLGSAIFGAIVAIILSFLRLNLFFIVLISILAVFLWQQLF